MVSSLPLEHHIRQAVKEAHNIFVSVKTALKHMNKSVFKMVSMIIYVRLRTVYASPAWSPYIRKHI